MHNLSLTIEDVIDELDKIHSEALLLLSSLHQRLEQRAKSTVSLAQLNELFNSHASSLVELCREEFKDYINVRPVEVDGKQDAFLSWDGKATKTELLLQIRCPLYLDKWRAFLLHCCPIYESQLWDHAVLFDLESPTKEHLPTMKRVSATDGSFFNQKTVNGDLETSASSTLKALCKAFPEIRLVEDRNHGERLLFYPSNEPPKLSKDYMYYLFFKLVQAYGEIRFSELFRKMQLDYRITLDEKTLRRIFRSNESHPFDIIESSVDFPKKKFKVDGSPNVDDFLLSRKTAKESEEVTKSPIKHRQLPSADVAASGTLMDVNKSSCDPSVASGTEQEQEESDSLSLPSVAQLKEVLLAVFSQRRAIKYSELSKRCLKTLGIELTTENLQAVSGLTGTSQEIIASMFEGLVRINGLDYMLTAVNVPEEPFKSPVKRRQLPSAAQLKEVLLAEISRRGSITHWGLFLHCLRCFSFKLNTGNLQAICGHGGTLKELLISLFEGKVEITDSFNFTFTLRSDLEDVPAKETLRVVNESSSDPCGTKQEQDKPSPLSTMPHPLPSAAQLKDVLLAELRRRKTMNYLEISDHCFLVFGMQLTAKNLREICGTTGKTHKILCLLFERQVKITGIGNYTLQYAHEGEFPPLTLPPLSPTAAKLKEVLLAELRRAGSISTDKLNSYCVAVCGISLSTANLKRVYRCVGRANEILSALFEGQVEISDSVNGAVYTIKNYNRSIKEEASGKLNVAGALSSNRERGYRPLTPAAAQLKEVLLAEIRRRGSITYLALAVRYGLFIVNIETICGTTGERRDLLRSLLEDEVEFSDSANFTLTARNASEGSIKQTTSAVAALDANPFLEDSFLDAIHRSAPRMAALRAVLIAKIREKGRVSYLDLTKHCRDTYGFGLRRKNLEGIYNLSGTMNEMLQTLLGDEVVVTSILRGGMLSIREPHVEPESPTGATLLSATQLRELLLPEIRRRGSMKLSELSEYFIKVCGCKFNQRNLEKLCGFTGDRDMKEMLATVFKGYVTIGDACDFVLAEKIAPDSTSSSDESSDSCMSEEEPSLPETAGEHLPSDPDKAKSASPIGPPKGVATLTSEGEDLPSNPEDVVISSNSIRKSELQMLGYSTPVTTSIPTSAPLQPFAVKLQEVLLPEIRRRGSMKHSELSEYSKRVCGFDLNHKNLQTFCGFNGDTKDLLAALFDGEVEICGNGYCTLTATISSGPSSANPNESITAMPSPSVSDEEKPSSSMISAAKLKTFLLAEIRRRGSITYLELSKHCDATCGIYLTKKNLREIFGCTGKPKAILDAIFEGQVEVEGSANFTLTVKSASELDVGSESETPESPEQEATHSERSTADTLVEFLEESGGISVMVTDIQALVERRCHKVFEGKMNYSAATSYAWSLVAKSDGRLKISFSHGLVFIGLSS